MSYLKLSLQEVRKMGRKQNPEYEFEWIPFCDYCFEEVDDRKSLKDIAPPHTNDFPAWVCEVCEQCLKKYPKEEMIRTVWERKFGKK